MNRTRTTFSGTALMIAGALLAGPVALADQPPDEEGINLCVEMREKIYECKEQFAEAFVSHHQPPADKRAAMKAKALEEITADGSGPPGPRRQVCAEMASKGMRPPADKMAGLKKGLAECSAKPDCDARVSCLMPLIKPMVGKGKSVKR